MEDLHSVVKEAFAPSVREQPQKRNSKSSTRPMSRDLNRTELHQLTVMTLIVSQH